MSYPERTYFQYLPVGSSNMELEWYIAGAGVTPDKLRTYDEPAAGESSLVFEQGWKLMRYFLGP